MNLLRFVSFLLFAVPIWVATCIVELCSNGTGDASTIKDAFAECGQYGTVTFLNETYNIGTVMDITGLNNCVVDFYGALLVSYHLSLGRQGYDIIYSYVEPAEYKY